MDIPRVLEGVAGIAWPLLRIASEGVDLTRPPHVQTYTMLSTFTHIPPLLTEVALADA
jgi:hypothetical protein